MPAPETTPPTPAYQHANTFADKDGRLTSESIAARQAQLNDTGYIADLRRRAVLSVEPNLTTERICAVGNRNPARSGIWNDDGTLNPDRLKALRDRCVVGEDGTRVLTRSIFQAFVNERRSSENRGWMPHALAFGNLTWVKPHRVCPFKVPVPFTAVTDGSIDAFFKAYSDRQHHGAAAVTWDAVCGFYDPGNTSQLCERR